MQRKNRGAALLHVQVKDARLATGLESLNREREKEAALLHVQAEELRLATGEEEFTGHSTHVERLLAPGPELEYLPAAQGVHSALAFESVCCVCVCVFICRHINFCIFVNVYNTWRVIARPATSEYFPAGHRTHAVLPATSEYVPAGHEQHALVALSPLFVAFPVCVECFFFKFQGYRGQAPYGANRRAPRGQPTCHVVVFWSTRLVSYRAVFSSCACHACAAIGSRVALVLFNINLKLI